jgi:hypothetical protein
MLQLVRRAGPRIYRRRLPRYRRQPSTRAKRGSKLTAVNVIKAIVIFRTCSSLKTGSREPRQFQQRDYFND